MIPQQIIFANLIVWVKSLYLKAKGVPSPVLTPEMFLLPLVTRMFPFTKLIEK